MLSPRPCHPKPCQRAPKPPAPTEPSPSAPPPSPAKPAPPKTPLSTASTPNKSSSPPNPPKKFATLRSSHLEQFQPATALETELVETLAATRWRLRRLSSIEADLLQNHAIEKVRQLPPHLLQADAQLAWSFKNLTDTSHAFSMIVRYEATLSRTYDRTLKQLDRMRKQQNEPTVPSAPET